MPQTENRSIYFLSHGSSLNVVITSSSRPAFISAIQAQILFITTSDQGIHPMPLWGSMCIVTVVTGRVVVTVMLGGCLRMRIYNYLVFASL